MTNTNTSSKTRKLVTLSLLTAITFILGLTPVGYIRINPAMTITLLCIPVIIGTITEGLRAGLFLGGVFGLTSLIQVFMGDPLGLMLMNISPVRTVAMIFIPRLIVPAMAYLSHMLFQKSSKFIVNKSSYVVTALVGSLSNTFFFLGFLYLLFIPEMAEVAAGFGTTAEKFMGVLGAIVVSNGIPEAIAAAIIVPLILIPLDITLNKTRKETVDDSNI